MTDSQPGLSMLLTRVVLMLAAATDGTAASDVARPNNVQLGPRPFFLLSEMENGPLKSQLKACTEGPFRPSGFSIGHRGAPLQFPEHTRESYEAAARMGAGVIECDVTFTKDKQLVCRHAQNDLHTTTNILATPLANRCIKPFTPATFDTSGNLLKSAAAECRTSEITLAEFKTLTGKMDSFNPRARTPAEYMAGTANWRTDLYAGPTSGTLLTHRESIELFQHLGVKMTPELKFPSVRMPFEGFTQEAFAQKLIDEYKAANVSPAQVFPQSFNKPDLIYWIEHEPAFGRQAVYLDDAEAAADVPTAPELAQYRKDGIRIWAPPIWVLLGTDNSGRIVPSQAAIDARAADLDLITWSLERSGLLADGDDDFYYQSLQSAIKREGDVYRVLDALARQVGVIGVFSDWPATVTYYANCMGRK